ncbi:MAG: carboxypeptidase-like regulatory domain-containing protein [Bacteroidetes bacterium]|nr:carboxypeptidase-like regulatory domain-containing protein [Bacteroidota bacterium]MDA0885171.1 carboxypeptidase-like regulatory domain-containing protein [Bacteroidota bacterium]
MRIIFSTVFLLFSLLSNSQNSVTGIVSDENGIPLPGANVIIEGTSTGVSTDFDGNFEITANQGQVLAISYIGYLTQYINVSGQTNINISLQLDNELEEVVVTALGFSVVRDQQGSTSSVVNTDDVIRSGETTVINALSGKASEFQ